MQPAIRSAVFQVTTNSAGASQFTAFGEWPIFHGATSFTTEIYEGAPGLWAGVYGPSDRFEERLSGQLFILEATSAVPEPATIVLTAPVLLSLALSRRSRS